MRLTVCIDQIGVLKNMILFLENAITSIFWAQLLLIVSVTGEIDPETGYVIDVKILKDFIKSEVEDAFDHKNLNLDVPEFKDLNPTAENIVVVIYNKLNAVLDSI